MVSPFQPLPDDGDPQPAGTSPGEDGVDIYGDPASRDVNDDASGSGGDGVLLGVAGEDGGGMDDFAA